MTDTNIGLIVFNISDPANPVIIDSLDPGGYTRDVFVKDSIAYVSDGGNDISIISIANPDSMYIISKYNTSYAYEAVVIDTILYIADSNLGLDIVSITNPAAPYRIGYYETGSTSHAVFVQGFNAYIADGEDGLYILKFPMDAIVSFDLSGTVGLSDNPADSSDTYVSIAALGLLDTTDIHGYYEFTGLDAGTYTVTFSHTDYITDTVDIGVYSDKVFNIVLNTIIPYYDITGIVGLSDNPADSSDSYISIVELALIDTTDAHGYYEFLNIAGDIYTLIYDHDTYKPDTIIDSLDGDHVINITLLALSGISDIDMNRPTISDIKTEKNISFVYNKLTDKPSTVCLYDVSGREIFRKEINEQGLYKVQTGNMIKGVYFLRIDEQEIIHKRKLILIK
ncbi:T9SS type A sorting domain-containing protein [candidate division WOR-3 bacterium]|nr:T9SS type A sorting domain-containing protein [candidate division WOR-3 bacterium]